jgi:hypothetical protein
MSISSVSPSVALPIVPASAGRAQASPVQQASTPVVPPAVKAGGDSDGDHDGSGGRINVKA